MTTIPALAPHTAAVKAALELVGDLGVYVGRGPDRPHEAVPYAVIYPYTPTYDGPIDDIHADVDYRAQIKTVGGTDEQAEDAADRVRARLLADGGITPPAGRVFSGPIRCEPLRGAERDDDARLTTPLWMVDELYVLPTTPA